MNKNFVFGDNEPGIYRQRAIVEFRILEEKLDIVQLKKYLKILVEKLGMQAHQDQPEPLVVTTHHTQYERAQAFLFCVEAGLHLSYWEKHQFITLDIHAGVVLSQQSIEQVTRTMFEIIEYSHLELLPENAKKDNVRVELRGDHKLGRAIFAKENIARGELIGGLYGDIYEADDSSALPEGVADHALQFARNKWRLSHEGGLVQYENHSCEPNVGMRGLFDVVAMRDIKAGEELVADYAVMEDSDWQFPEGKCLCESSHCRQTFLPFRSLSSKDQETIEDHLSPWIKRKYAQKKEGRE